MKISDLKSQGSSGKTELKNGNISQKLPNEHSKKSKGVSYILTHNICDYFVVIVNFGIINMGS